ncbi:MAG: hypothetical protein GOU97_01715 [Nanoarchaeota archaeon]|nr:hypothetical protein [Nanoarchaeota archaeon]
MRTATFLMIILLLTPSVLAQNQTTEQNGSSTQINATVMTRQSNATNNQTVTRQNASSGERNMIQTVSVVANTGESTQLITAKAVQIKEQARVLISSNASQGEMLQVREEIRQRINESLIIANMTSQEVKALVQERVVQRTQIIKTSLVNNTSKPLPRVMHTATLVEYIRNLKDVSELNQSGIGKNVSQIAVQMNASIQRIEQAEQNIQAQGIGVAIRNFFFGGDKTSANQLLEETNQTRIRLQKIEELKNQSQDPEIRAMLQEQIEGMNQTVQKMELLAVQEKAKKGIFSFLFG